MTDKQALAPMIAHYHDTCEKVELLEAVGGVDLLTMDGAVQARRNAFDCWALGTWEFLDHAPPNPGKPNDPIPYHSLVWLTCYNPR